FYDWQIVPGGAPTAWANINHAGDDIGLTRFGDFDGDGRSDVFAAQFSPDQWVISSGGTAPYEFVADATASWDNIAVGQFDGDPGSDVLFSVDTSGGSGLFQYNSFPPGSFSIVTLSDHHPAQATQLLLGDFDGDGKTDTFNASDLGTGSFSWVYQP